MASTTVAPSPPTSTYHGKKYADFNGYYLSPSSSSTVAVARSTAHSAVVNEGSAARTSSTRRYSNTASSRQSSNAASSSSSSARSSSQSSSSSSSSSPMLTSTLSTSSYVSGEAANSTVTTVPDSSSSSHGSPALSMAAGIAIAVVGTLTIVGAITLCYLYTRRRRRLQKLPVESKEGRSAAENKFLETRERATTSSSTFLLPTLLHRSDSQISRHDIQGVVLPQAPPTAFYPASLSPLALHAQSPFRDPVGTSSPTNSRRPLSDYTDNSEVDMIAQDGSSYARTLSTYSDGVNSEFSERDLDSYIPPAAEMAQVRPRLVLDTKTVDGPSQPSSTWDYTAVHSGSSGWGSMPGTTLNTATTARDLLSPFADHAQSQSTLTSGYLSHHPPSIHSDSDRSWRTEDDALLQDRATSRPTGGSASGTLVTEAGLSRGGLQRGMTIVRHRDAGSVGEGEVHLPPSYGDLYPH